MTDTFTWVANEGATSTPKQRVLSAVFGDGYQQDSPDGPNPVTESWAFSMEGYSAEITPIIAFLKAHVGITFFWTPPLNPQSYYICTSYAPKHKEADVWTLDVTFEERFKP